MRYGSTIEINFCSSIGGFWHLTLTMKQLVTKARHRCQERNDEMMKGIERERTLLSIGSRMTNNRSSYRTLRVEVVGQK